MKQILWMAVLALVTATAMAAEGKGNVKVLIVGGGASHDYDTWFNKEDTKTLEAIGAEVTYTEDTANMAERIKAADVLYLSNNKPFGDRESKAAIFEHVEAGKGLLLVHPALWYNWADWPEYNRDIASGGSRAHDRLGEFEVNVTGKHPVVAGVSEKFKIIDELYYFERDMEGPPIEVLATAYSERKQREYPVVFIVKHPKTRIVGLTLGHDGRAHRHEDYVKLLCNALKWVGVRTGH